MLSRLRSRISIIISDISAVKIENIIEKFVINIFDLHVFKVTESFIVFEAEKLLAEFTV
jgi:hypothetical protein